MLHFVEQAQVKQVITYSRIHWLDNSLHTKNMFCLFKVASKNIHGKNSTHGSAGLVEVVLLRLMDIK